MNPRAIPQKVRQAIYLHYHPEAGRIRELERALDDACDVAIWLTGMGPIDAPAWPAMREKLNKAMKARGESA